MHKIIGLVCLLGCFYSCEAQYPGYIPIVHPETFKEVFARQTALTESVQADFIQEKNLSMLSEKISSAGKFWFQKKDKLRMEYIHPYAYIMILNAGKIYIKDGQKENRLSAGSNKVFQQVNRILLDCVGGNMLNNPDFQSRVFENSSFYLIELIPTTKNLKDLYKNINIVLDRKDYSVQSLSMVELTGDDTKIHFQNKKLNAPIPASVFTIP